MHLRIIVPALVALSILVACGGSGDGGGAVRDVPAEPEAALYSPESRDALALGLPEQVGGHVLWPSEPDEIAAEEVEYYTDPRVKRILVERGFAPSRVTLEQKTARISGPPSGRERIPPVAVAAVQVRQVAARDFIEWDPTFYMLLTSVDGGDYEWQGEKPDDDPQTIAGRELRVADFNRFKVAWYPYGDVLYVIVAASDQLLESTVSKLPWPSTTT